MNLSKSKSRKNIIENRPGLFLDLGKLKYYSIIEGIKMIDKRRKITNLEIKENVLEELEAKVKNLTQDIEYINQIQEIFKSSMILMNII